MAKPRVSVIIPTYNRAAYIADAIKSVLEQQDNKWETEIIVVDDGSSDNTAEILKQFGEKVTYIKIKPSGRPAVPRNVGIRQAKGELIAFQDSDDKWFPDKLASQVPLFDNPATVMSCGHAVIMEQNGSVTNKRIETSEALKKVEKFSNLLKMNSVSTLTTMVRRSALETVGLFDESEGLKAVEDYELWLRIAVAFPGGVKTIDKNLAYYRTHEGNISQADALLAVERLINVYNTLWNFSTLKKSQRLQLERQLADMQENWSRLKVESGDHPAISVVMSVYNSQTYLQRAIDSILNQTFKDFEFIIIEDGSTEPVLKQLWEIKDPRVRVLPQTNHGLVYSLNQGVKLGRGTFIARQDSDDISQPERFAKELDLMKSDERLAVVGSFFTYVDLEDKPSITIVMPTMPEDIHLCLLYTNPIGHGSALIRRKALIEAGLYSDNYHAVEDYNLWRQLAPYWRFAIVPESLYLYRLNPASISHSKQSTQHGSRDQLVEELWNSPIPPISPFTIRKHYKKYTRLPHSASSVVDVYKNMLYHIAFESLRRKKLKFFLCTWSGLVLIAPVRALRVLFDVLKRGLHKALVKLKVRS